MTHEGHGIINLQELANSVIDDLIKRMLPEVKGKVGKMHIELFSKRIKRRFPGFD